MNFKTEDFPVLQPASNIDNHTYFQEEIVSLYFQLHRNHSFISIHNLYLHTVDVLKFLKVKIKDPAYKKYIHTLFLLIIQTRDVIYGKGEHTLSYMLLLAFYSFDPTLSIFALHRFVSPTEQGSHYYGSWRDIKHLCQFIKEHSKEGENHPLISYSIEIMNTELYKDIQTYKFSANCFSKKHISNVCKWIPREKKNKFAWLFNKLAYQYSNTHKHYIFDNITTIFQHEKAMNKAKKFYRKTFSFLNKQIQTTEILLTQKNYKAIEPKNVCLQTYVNQNHLFDISENEEKQLCVDKIKQHFESTFQKKESFLFKNDFRNVNHISLSFLVKYAILALKHQHNDIQQFINQLWKKVNILIPHFEKDFFIPVVDISLYSTYDNSESFYSSLGLAIMLSEYSNLENRIIAMDKLPIWIQFQKDYSFTQKVQVFLNEIAAGKNTEPNYLHVIDLISQGFSQSNASSYFVKNVNIVFFSPFSESTFPSSFFDSYYNFFQKYTKSPKLTFWNTSTQGTSFPFQFDNDRFIYMSGFSSSVLKQFIKINKKRINKPQSAFEFIETMCKIPYYDVFSNYLLLHI